MTLASALSAGAPVSAQEDFERMAEYLARGSGRWRADNPNHDPGNPRSPVEFGLWFERRVGGSMLEITIVSYVGDRVIESTRGSWFWHPGDRTIVYSTVSRGGGVSRGTTTFTNDTTFVTLTENVNRGGRVSEHKDENFILGDDVHGNTSYRRGANGAWIAQGSYVWRRDP